MNHFAVARCNLERQTLPCNDASDLPVLAPVTGHLHPARSRPLDLDVDDVSRPGDVVDQDEHPVGVPLDLELDPSFLHTGCSAVPHGDDPGSGYCDLREHGHGEIEVLLRRVAPDACCLRVVCRAEVGCGHNDRTGPFDAPLRVVHACDLETGTAGQAIVKEGRAQGCRGQAIALLEQISVATSTLCKYSLGTIQIKENNPISHTNSSLNS